MRERHQRPPPVTRRRGSVRDLLPRTLSHLSSPVLARLGLLLWVSRRPERQPAAQLVAAPGAWPRGRGQLTHVPLPSQ